MEENERDFKAAYGRGYGDGITFGVFIGLAVCSGLMSLVNVLVWRMG